MNFGGVAALAARIIRSEVRVQLAVRRMAGETIQTSGAVAEAGAGGKPQRLIAGVVKVRQIGDLLTGFVLFDVALGTEFVHRRRGQLAWSAERVVRGVRGVRGARTVTDFAANAEFVRLDVVVSAKGNRPGRMAGETAQNARYGIERAEDDAIFIAMAR